MASPDPATKHAADPAAAPSGRVAELEAEVAALRAALARSARRELPCLAIESIVSHAVLTTDMGGHITYWSEGARRLFGYERHEILGRPADLLFPTEERSLGIPGQLVREALEGQPLSGERWLIRKDGSRLWASGTIMPLLGDPFPGVVGIVRDATDRHQFMAALRESAAWLSALIDTLPGMVWVTDPVGYCTHLNRRWSQFTGQAEEEGLGFGWLEMVHPDDRARTERAFRSANARRMPYRAEYRMRRYDGNWHWAIDTAEPRFADDKVFLGYVGAVIDITDRKEAEERQALLAREIDHRAKNALAVVQATVELTHADSVEEFTKAVAGRISALAAAHSLLAKGNWSGTDIRALVRAELAPFPGGAKAWVLDGPPVTLIPAAVQALGMAFHELATNAVKHGSLSSPGGRVLISWEADRAGGVLRIRWSESGGPVVSGEPSRHGFGSSVLDTTIRHQLGGVHSRSWRPGGMEFEASIPLGRAVVGHGYRQS